jgi:leucyl aminopeptidase
MGMMRGDMGGAASVLGTFKRKLSVSIVVFQLVSGWQRAASSFLLASTRPLGTLLALSRMKANGHFVGVIPLCENMPSGKALKPGDVITARSGTTVEV